jgi:CheY-like chemotaxis protein
MANVLVVDDSPDTLALTTELLESAGYKIRTGYNGRDGLKSLDEGPLPDCVLLDVDMPVLDGPGMAHEMLLHDAGGTRSRDPGLIAASHFVGPFFAS